MNNFLINYLGTSVAYAETKVSPIVTFVGKINRLILNPLITLMFAAALVYFLYGVLKYFLSGGEVDRKNGQDAIMWGLIGMFIMFSVMGIIKLIQSTLGVTGQTDLSNFP